MISAWTYVVYSKEEKSPVQHHFSFFRIEVVKSARREAQAHSKYFGAQQSLSTGRKGTTTRVCSFSFRLWLSLKEEGGVAGGSSSTRER
jgi:hypothetical protein